MKKLILLIVLLPGLAGAAVTQAQVKQARQASIAVSKASEEMFQYCNRVNALFDSNFVLTISGTDTTVVIPQSAQDEIIDVARYQALKAQLVAAFNQFP